LHAQSASIIMVSQPQGSAVGLESPGEAKCKATNITRPGDHPFKFEVSDGTSTVAGSYVFELTVVDRTKFATKDVAVTVAGERPASQTR
jgi:hypothetical protein